MAEIFVSPGYSFSDRSQFNGIYFIISIWQFMHTIITLILHNFLQISITVYYHINSFRGPSTSTIIRRV